MHEIHLKIDLIPSITSDCEYIFDYSTLQYNLDTSFIFKNLEDNSIFQSPLTTALEVVLSGIIFQSKNIHIDEYVGGIESHFYPLNCSCGHPECMGISNGVIIKKNDKFITWKSDKKSGYSKYLPAIMNFNRSQYISFILEMRNKLIQLELETPNTYRIKGATIPNFFKEIARLQALIIRYKFTKNFFKTSFIVEENLNNFHDKELNRSNSTYFIEYFLWERFYNSLTKNLFKHVTMNF